MTDNRELYNRLSVTALEAAGFCLDAAHLQKEVDRVRRDSQAETARLKAEVDKWRKAAIFSREECERLTSVLAGLRANPQGTATVTPSRTSTEIFPIGYHLVSLAPADEKCGQCGGSGYHGDNATMCLGCAGTGRSRRPASPAMSDPPSDEARKVAEECAKIIAGKTTHWDASHWSELILPIIAAALDRAREDGHCVGYKNGCKVSWEVASNYVSKMLDGETLIGKFMEPWATVHKRLSDRLESRPAPAPLTGEFVGEIVRDYFFCGDFTERLTAAINSHFAAADPKPDVPPAAPPDDPWVDAETAVKMGIAQHPSHTWQVIINGSEKLWSWYQEDPKDSYRNTKFRRRWLTPAEAKNAGLKISTSEIWNGECISTVASVWPAGADSDLPVGNLYRVKANPVAAAPGIEPKP